MSDGRIRTGDRVPIRQRSGIKMIQRSLQLVVMSTNRLQPRRNVGADFKGR